MCSRGQPPLSLHNFRLHNLRIHKSACVTSQWLTVPWPIAWQKRHYNVNTQHLSRPVASIPFVRLWITRDEFFDGGVQLIGIPRARRLTWVFSNVTWNAYALKTAQMFMDSKCSIQCFMRKPTKSRPQIIRIQRADKRQTYNYRPAQQGFHGQRCFFLLTLHRFNAHVQANDDELAYSCTRGSHANSFNIYRHPCVCL